MSTTNTPGALVRAIREYLAVHPDLALSGQAMDNMALELARVAIGHKDGLQTAAAYALDVLQRGRGKQATIRAIERLQAALGGLA